MEKDFLLFLDLDRRRHDGDKRQRMERLVVLIGFSRVTDREGLLEDAHCYYWKGRRKVNI